VVISDANMLLVPDSPEDKSATTYADHSQHSRHSRDTNVSNHSQNLF